MIDSYNDLVKEIEIHQNLKDAAEKNYWYNRKILHETDPHMGGGSVLSDMPKGSPIYADLEPTINKCIKFKADIKKEDNFIKSLEKNKRVIEKDLKELTGLQHKVRYMHDIEGKTYSEIAEELNYEYGYVRKLANKK